MGFKRWKRVAHKTYLLTFKSQQEMARTLIRFQEFYENPKYRGKVFSFKEIEAWWRKKGGGRMTYYSDWSGFNFPSWVLEVFGESFKHITRRERSILNLFKRFKHPFYVIAAVEGDEETIDHELTHAMYEIARPYHIEVNQIISKHKKKLKPLFRWLRKQGYANDPLILADEANAYLTCDTEYLNDKGVKWPSDVALELWHLRMWYSFFLE